MRVPELTVLTRWKRWVILRVTRNARRDVKASKRNIVPCRRPLLRIRAEMANAEPERTVHVAVARSDCCSIGAFLCPWARM